MKNFLRALLLISIFSTVIFSCTKNTGPAEPIILLAAPTDTTTFHADSVVFIQGSVSDNKDLHEIYFSIKKNATDSIYDYRNPYVHGGKVYPFVFNSVPLDSGIYTLSIKVLDHDGHATQKELLLNVD